MKLMNTTEEQKEFLREKIRELHSKSLTQREIATVMHCSVATVNRHIQSLRQQAKENINKYIEETLVEEFDKIGVGLQLIVKNSWERYEKATTDKERYAFLSLAKDTYQLRATLLDSGTIVQKAVQFVNSQTNTRGLTTKNNEVIIDNTVKSREKMEKLGNVSTEHKQSH